MIGELAKLTRIEHAVMLALGVLIAEIIILGELPPVSLIIIMSLLVPVFSEMGSFALNDYFDIETDKLNKKDRPLVNGTITPKFALSLSIITLIISTVMAYFINIEVFIIALIFNIVAILYNWKLKDMPLVGNIYIAFTMAIPFIFGNFVISNTLSELALVLASLGFVAGLAREIIKSVQDMDGDIKARGSKTLPVIVGEKVSVLIACAMYVSFIPLTAIPFFIGLKISIIAIVLIGIADVMILIICAKSISKDYKFARNMSLIAFLIGLIGLLFAALG
ncbi:MAG: UbiA family prenyltransferase [Candidatus Micrarchaeota archaeon]|nr:UbiA family prenyltransferase [Candidatus Micrarchaeota archaeon]